jgi:hypothetical protein
MTGSGKSTLLIGGIAAGVGAALLLNSRRKPDTVETRRGYVRVEGPDGHWSPTTRLAVGALGGGLMLYGMRAPGTIARMAATAGAGMVMRCVMDKPIQDWTELLKPHTLMGDVRPNAG